MRSAIKAGWHEAGFDKASGLHVLQTIDAKLAAKSMDTDDMDAQLFCQTDDFCNRHNLPLPFGVIWSTEPEHHF